MTKNELAKLVEQIYATYNQKMPENESVYSAWYALLHDLPYRDAQKAFVSIAVSATFMPRPGDVRRATINMQNKIAQFEDPLSAWGKFVSIQKNLHNGVGNSIAVSEALKLTVAALGEAAIGMHTNSDRDAFIRTYERIVSEIDAARYAVPDLEENPG